MPEHKAPVDYSQVFDGMKPIDRGRMAQIRSLEDYVPLWEALKKNPGAAQKISADNPPFVWKHAGVEYTTGRLALAHSILFQLNSTPIS